MGVHTKRYQEFLGLLRRARLDADMSQVDLAEALGRSQQFVSKCELGERRVDIDELLDFADALGVRVEALIPGHRR